MGGSADVGGGGGVRAANASQGDFPCERSSTSPEDKQGTKRAKRGGISRQGNLGVGG